MKIRVLVCLFLCVSLFSIYAEGEDSGIALEDEVVQTAEKEKQEEEEMQKVGAALKKMGRGALCLAAAIIARLKWSREFRGSSVEYGIVAGLNRAHHRVDDEMRNLSPNQEVSLSAKIFRALHILVYVLGGVGAFELGRGFEQLFSLSGDADLVDEGDEAGEEPNPSSEPTA